MNKRTMNDLKYFQSMPLDVKIGLTKNRIREWVNQYGTNGVYISFSGRGEVYKAKRLSPEYV